MNGPLKLDRAERYDTRSSSEVYIDCDSIESIQEAIVGERSKGSKITTKSGSEILVWQDPNTVYKRMFELNSQ